MSYNVTITSKGQLTLPVKIRKALGIDDTHRTLSLRFDEETQKVTLEKPVSFAEIRAYVQKHARDQQPIDLENIHERYQDYRLEELKKRGVI